MNVPAPRAALLSESASRDARALVRWTTPELDAIARTVANALARAARRWGGGERVDRHVETLASARLHVIHAEDAEPALRSAPWTSLGPRARWSLAADPVQCLREALFGESPVVPSARDGRRIADELAAECWAEQCAALQALLDEATANAARAMPDSPSDPWQRWSGAVVVDVPWFGASWRLLIDAAAVRGLPQLSKQRRPEPAGIDREAPMPVLRALGRTPVRLQVRLAPVDIDFGSLISLNIGDVLRVGHAVDEPVHVGAPGSPIDATPLCHGWLGARDERVAIELLRLRAAASTTR